MALQKIRLGTNEDGTPQYHYVGDHVVLTGNASGQADDRSFRVNVYDR